MCSLAAVLLLLMPAGLFASRIKDSESTTHGADASQYSIVETYTFPGFSVIQIDLPVLSVYSYLLVSKGDALVIDPVRDTAIYTDTAKTAGATIKGVYLSHSHADFVAGHMELKKKLNCPIYQSHNCGAEYEFTAMDESSIITIGDATLKFMDTPGHTPDGMCAAVYSKENPNVPELIFTGDVLFVGSVGRPDLMEGTTSAAWLAAAMYRSWTEKLSRLDDRVLVFPAHGAGSLCGAHLSSDPNSSIGRERTSNPYLKNTNKNEFIMALLEGLPDAPQYFKHNASMNKNGPEIVQWNASLPPETQPSKALTDITRYYVVDLRDAGSFASGHIPNSVNIAARGRLETWVGIMVPWDSKLILTGSDDEIKESMYRLNRVGYHAGYVGMDSWKKAALPLTISSPIKADDLYASMQRGDAPIIVDVRLPSEWIAMRIGTILNMPLNMLAIQSPKLDPQEPLVVVCNSAYRSSMAVGVLERAGFMMARNLEGGSEAWINAGYPVYESAKAGMAEAAPKIRINLPERLSSDALNRMMMDLPNSFELVDIRPADMFQDYQLPGSLNADPAEVMNNPSYLGGSVPLVLVDRDGSIAMAIGGILSQKTQRPIKVLHGGLEAYWATYKTMGSGMNVKETVPLSEPMKRSAPSPAPIPASDKPKTPKKSAGC